MCICVYMCMCVCACPNVCMYLCACVCMCICVYEYVYVCVRMYELMRVCVPLEALPFKVEAGGDIRKDFVTRVLTLHFFRLVDEIKQADDLVHQTNEMQCIQKDPAVDCSFGGRGLLNFFDDRGAVDAADIVSSMITTCSDVLDEAAIGKLGQRSRVEAKSLGSRAC